MKQNNDIDISQNNDIDISKIPVKQQIIAVLDQEGFTPPEIAKGLNITQQRVSQVKSKFKKSGIIRNIKDYKNAVKAHRKIVNAFLDPDKESLPFTLKGSDVNTCIDRIFDRFDPVVRQSMNLNVNADISPVDLSKYLNKDDDL